MIPKLDEYKKRWNIASENMVKPGLESIRAALRKVDDPHKKLQVIHVAGTNGKGSTIAFMEAILREHGFTTGVFSSPAIVDIHDQIRLNGEPVSEEELNQSFQSMNEAGLSGMLTDFELLTAAAFVTFGRVNPDFVLLETGMGGTLDSTNVVEPLVSVITSIALDHTAILGDTIEEIAVQKAGIIKPDKPVVTGPLPIEAMKVVADIARKSASRLLVYGTDFSMEVEEVERFHGTDIFQLSGRKMKGPHQAINAAVGIQSLLTAGVPLVEDKVSRAIAETGLKNRFEEVAPNIFVDGTHNPAAAKALAETIRETFPGEKVDFIIGMLKGKDVRRTLDELMPVAASFSFLTFPHPQAETPETMMEQCKHPNKRVINEVGKHILLQHENGRKKIVTGSLYLLMGLYNQIRGK
ncbi:folylpolyglutamate synthase/dihydrofolate synthase family protein [Sporosarcina sp. 179-K 3D1 HS]|uniref:bifunctional folylpolyglutamate synthase/dihydrofolate synthase n=1 Tax=Sporosarcina sp. 179-K 3D1 HS TaxID=3232169 RepID=UPI0039A3DA56